MASILRKAARRVLKQQALGHMLRRGATWGRCPICQGLTVFYAEDDWLRDNHRCLRCYSIPRWRALIQALETQYPNWRDMDIHESSPGGSATDKIRRECRGYSASYFYPDAEPGSSVDGFRSENLEAMTFADESFDLVITQDVLEHVFDPAAAFAEIARVLRPGGAHVFTVPCSLTAQTRVRAVRENGEVHMLEKPDYHHDPIDPQGALVVTNWGSDMPEFIERHSGLTTDIVGAEDPKRGIVGPYREVFISRKPGR